MYGSRESRIPYIRQKGFFRRYSQSVESIFFFLRLSGTYVLMDMHHDLPGKGRGDS